MSPSPSQIPIFTHPNPRTTLLPHLPPYLPTPLPLTRRLQFHFHSPHSLALATFLPSTSTTPPPTPPFAALYLDRSRSPETEAWLFSSIELSLPAAAPSTEEIQQARSQLLSLLLHISSLPLPPSYEGRDPESGGRFLVLGSVHERTLALLRGWRPDQAERSRDVSVDAAVGGQKEGPQREGSQKDVMQTVGGGGGGGKVVYAQTVAYVKYLFTPPTATGEGEGRKGDGEVGGKASLPALPEGLGLEWTTSFSTPDFELVRSRTSVPRRDRTLRLLPGLGLRSGEGRLVSWAFLSPDGSLASLHVEPEFRGRGLGKKVAGGVMGMLGGRVEMDAKGEGEGEGGGGEGEGGTGDGQGGLYFEGVREGEEWGHADVAVDNKDSRGVTRGLGGKEGWICYWVWIDLEGVKAEVERLER